MGCYDTLAFNGFDAAVSTAYADDRTLTAYQAECVLIRLRVGIEQAGQLLIELAARLTENDTVAETDVALARGSLALLAMTAASNEELYGFVNKQIAREHRERGGQDRARAPFPRSDAPTHPESVHAAS